MDTASKRHWTTVVVLRKPGSMERCACGTARNSRAVPPHATPRTISLCLRTSKRTIQGVTSSLSRIISAAITVLRHEPGWPSIRACITSLSPRERGTVELARRLVAALAPRRVCRAEFRYPRGNRAGDTCRDGPAQPASHVLDLGSPSQGSSPLSARLLLPHLTNAAVIFGLETKK